MQPSVGRIVHYRSESDGPCKAALVVSVQPETGNLDLTVFEPQSAPSTSGRFGIEETDADNPVGGQWHWPERVE